MKNYKVTIGYKAVICVNIKAKDEKDAKDLAVRKLTNQKNKMFKNGIELQDDNFKADGCLDMDATWNMFDN